MTSTSRASWACASETPLVKLTAHSVIAEAAEAQDREHDVADLLGDRTAERDLAHADRLDSRSMPATASPIRLTPMCG